MSQKNESFPDVLTAWLRAKCLTVVEAAPLLGVSHQTVYNWLDGSMPPRTRMPALAAALGVPEARLRRAIERARHGAAASTVAPDAQPVRGEA